MADRETDQHMHGATCGGSDASDDQASEGIGHENRGTTAGHPDLAYERKSFDGGPVGYKRPPAENQFKKGQQKPRRSGRRKGRRNTRATIEELFGETVLVKVDEQSRKMDQARVSDKICLRRSLEGQHTKKAFALEATGDLGAAVY